MYSFKDIKVGKLRSRWSCFVVFFVVLSCISLFFVGLANASGLQTRQSIMDQEMDCITRNFQNGGGVSWQETCSSGNSYSSGRYDIAQLSKTDATRYSNTPTPSYKSYNDTSYTDRNLYDKYKAHDWDSSSSTHGSYEYQGSLGEDDFIQADLRLLGGLRRDDFNWNIAADITGNATPNILSELTWSDLKMTQVRLEGDVTLGNRFIVDGMVSYADIYDGDNQDSDYLGDDRTGEFSRSNNQSKDGEAFDWSAGIGYQVRLKPEDIPEYLMVDNLSVALLGGYSYHELNLIVTDGVQTIPALGPFGPTLHTSYWAEWDGPWLGFKVEGSRKKLTGFFRFEYHWADYYGSANWNLRDDFQHPKSFENIADGVGLVLNFGTNWEITENLDLNFRSNIQQWKAENGVDRVFFANGSTGETRFNEVNWDSKSFMLGSTYKF